MVCEIISVGTELLLGQIVNTNAQYIARRLAEVGVSVYYQSVVGDNQARLAGAVREALDRADIVITTGGLGPTGDDLTKETIAAVCGLKLVMDEATLEAISERFIRLGRKMTPNNLKQALIPRGAQVLPNAHGTAPGCIVNAPGLKQIVLLPGPPGEMRPMLDTHVIPYLADKSGKTLVSRVLRIFGMGESAVEYALKDLIQNQVNPTIAPYAAQSEVTLRITAMCSARAEGEQLIEPYIKEIVNRLGGVVYSLNDETLWQVCAGLLKKNGLKLAVAESCTGGMLSSLLVSVPGCSNWFTEGCVTYSDEAKARRLNVSQQTLKRYSAVSGQTAYEMANGIALRSGADAVLATTGYAGPDSGADTGLVYIAAGLGGDISVHCERLNGSREHIRYAACLHALNYLRKMLEKTDEF